MDHKSSGNKVAAGICGILLGALGIHKFILGKQLLV
jgi:TM2 domain-containing membrane protein YozV